MFPIPFSLEPVRAVDNNPKWLTRRVWYEKPKQSSIKYKANIKPLKSTEKGTFTYNKVVNNGERASFTVDTKRKFDGSLDPLLEVKPKTLKPGVLFEGKTEYRPYQSLYTHEAIRVSPEAKTIIRDTSLEPNVVISQARVDTVTGREFLNTVPANSNSLGTIAFNSEPSKGFSLGVVPPTTYAPPEMDIQITSQRNLPPQHRHIEYTNQT